MSTSERRDEICQTFSGTLVAFVGFWGEGGALTFRGGRWVFFPAGSVEWDDWHQQIYRNSKGEVLDDAALQARGIPPPPFDEYRGRPAMDWADNFESEIPLDAVPETVRDRLGEHWAPLFLILFEDGYETAFGDGRFLYPGAAFWSREEAEAWLRERERESADPARAPDPAKAEWYRYSLKEIRLRANRAANRLRAELDVAPYESIRLSKVMALIAG